MPCSDAKRNQSQNRIPSYKVTYYTSMFSRRRQNMSVKRSRLPRLFQIFLFGCFRNLPIGLLLFHSVASKRAPDGSSQACLGCLPTALTKLVFSGYWGWEKGGVSQSSSQPNISSLLFYRLWRWARERPSNLAKAVWEVCGSCLLYTSPSPRD